MASPADIGDDVRDAAHDAARDGWNRVQPLLDFRLLHVSGVTITVGGVVMALLVAIGAWLLAWLSRRALARYAARHPDVNQAALYTVSRVVTYVFIVAGVLLAFDAIGVPIGKFAVFAGALGVGLGFGLQKIIANFISGVILLADKSVKPGDLVTIGDSTREKLGLTRVARALDLGVDRFVPIGAPLRQMIETQRSAAR